LIVASAHENFEGFCLNLINSETPEIKHGCVFGDLVTVKFHPDIE
jgi:hypothetical protein